jgi:Pyrimidine dimer DNA glycosylase
MRLWSLHPSLLDARGLVALWREALLAQKVLQGKTAGYRAHPQLQRFRQSVEPLAAISAYLWAVHDEASQRGYAFDASKIAMGRRPMSLTVTRGQLAFEREHLTAKLQQREPGRLQSLRRNRPVKAHPLFVVVAGAAEPWERSR